jgi:CD63 antigen
MRSCSGSCLKLIVFLFNFLFVLFSLLLMIYGGLVIGNVFKWKQIYNISNAPFGILIAVGVFLFLLTFMGCCGAFMENTCMLMGFSYTVGALILLQIGAVVVAYRYRSNVEDGIIKEGQKLIDKYNKDGQGEITKFLDEMQQELRCCGMTNATNDWQKYEKENKAYPDSCCPKDQKPKTCTTPFLQPCSVPVKDAINKNTGALIGVVCGFIGIQFISMVLSCLLVASIKKDYFSFV